MIVVQEINILWSKMEREGFHADVLASVRTKFPLPIMPKGKNVLFYEMMVLHRHTYQPTKGWGWKQETLFIDDKIGNQFGAITVRRIRNHVTINYAYDRTTVGVPLRPKDHVTPLFELSPGSWGQITYNGEILEWDFWDFRYKKTVFNIAYFLDEVPRNVFLTAPLHSFNDLAQLY